MSSSAIGFDQTTNERMAELTVGFAANVQPGQIVLIAAEIGQEVLVRALTTAAYRHGARFVDPWYFDLHMKRARLELAADDTLDFVPPWYGERVLDLGRHGGAFIALTGPVAPGLLAGIDPVRAGRDQLPYLPEIGTVVNQRSMNWTVVPCPSPAWARQIYPDLPPDDALRRLCDELIHVCRLDEADPAAAWRRRSAALSASAEVLTNRSFDALRFRGPGTDLHVGLLPSARFLGADTTTAAGVRHLANLPTEEVYGSPDPTRTAGVVRATLPLALGGSVIRDLEVEFRDGRAVRIDASEGADVLRGYAARDEGACRLGEVALVDGDGRIGRLGTTFLETLLDENASSHIALGSAYESTVDEAEIPRLNRSGIHVDFMIGGDDVEVHGVTRGGEEVPVLVGGAWQI